MSYDDFGRSKKRGGGAGPARVIATALVLVLASFLLPALLCRPLPPPQPEAAPPAEQPEVSADHSRSVRVQGEDGTVVTLPLDEYLRGVVAAEMPASFEPEALAAQAAAARTYTLSRMTRVTAAHPDADVCTDSSCCQAWRSPDECATVWGARREEYEARIAEAVAATDGMVVLYQGEPIQAVFFSSAPGRTSAAVEVWGSEVPYLTGVDSPEGEQEVPGYHSSVTVGAEEFRTVFLREFPGAELSGAPESWFGPPERSSAGAVARLNVGGTEVTGGRLRRLFRLRSTCFSVSVQGDQITFSVTGYGHGVGMSQYGANTLARRGSSWQDILKWYYTGVEIGPMP